MIFEKVIYERPTGDEQYRLSLSEWNGQEVLSFRKYFLSFEEEWLPTKEGFSIPLDISTSNTLFEAILEIISRSEYREIISNLSEE